MTSETRPKIDPAAYEAFSVRQRRAWYAARAVLIAVAVAVLFAVGALWSPLAGVVIGAVVALIGWELLTRWNRRRWLNRFPALREQPITWKSRS